MVKTVREGGGMVEQHSSCMWMCAMNRILVQSDVIDHLLFLHVFQACDSVRHVDPALWTASHQGLGCDPADRPVLRFGQQEACGAWTYLFYY